VRDSAALLDATAGPEIGDPYWAPPPKRSFQAEVGADPGRLRIAFTTKPWNLHEVDSECADAVDEAAKLCEDLGHHVEEASPEIDEAALTKAIWIIIKAQTRALLQFATLVLGRQATSEDVEPVTWAYSEGARQFSASDYAEAITAVHRTGRVVDPFVANELSLPTFQAIRQPGDQPTKTFDLSADVALRLTPNFGIEIGDGYQFRKAVGSNLHTGFDNLKVGAKYQFLVNAEHETILSLGVDVEIGDTGRQAIGVDRFSTIVPGFFSAKDLAICRTPFGSSAHSR
jgi:Asp-tRNA(Asn)/Glu-tRNA(Gln) amidotransferase A subunit family amidase